jgi:PhzF family phenazine biosynthesis protein
MKQVAVHVVDAFVDGNRGGNPAGVVINAEHLSDREKQQTATKAGFSETAFISLSKVADFKVDFYTPVAQIADCGHATIATFSYLKQIGWINGNKSTKEITTGVRNIYIRDDMAFMEQMVPDYLPVSEMSSEVDNELILSTLDLEPADLLENYEPMITDNGVKGLIVPLKNEDSLVRINPDYSAIATICKKLNVCDYYAFSLETRDNRYDAGARMFAPVIGIPEESATGMAAGRLACYLYDFLNIKKKNIVIEQGFLMNPPAPSLLYAELDIPKDRIQGIRIGGRAVVKESLVIEIS